MEGGVELEPTRIMVGVNESTIKGYPHASISSKGAFGWTLNKIFRSNTSGFKLLFLHVPVPDEDGSLLSLSLCLELFELGLVNSICCLIYVHDSILNERM
ncbi:Universal stress protein A-like protein [Camellia lanceoleosa]|uniref:Universal stress protein A-like protein n=1 Tax=Camellia lanceoleosa TaxID=1840588 RepID=A0ACC0HJS1_9ERIC|nr:Universal stress protein A-like protein [Camellia lanceoleosa]